MSDIDQNAPSELEVLKQRARLMGVDFSNNIGLETLKERIAAKMAGEPEAATQTQPEAAQPNGLEAAQAIADAKITTPAAGSTPDTPTAAPKSFRQEMMDEQLRLVRLRITNLDPKKANLPGEIFTVANEVLGTIRKFIPYGEVTDDGYHVPYIIYQQLDSRKFLHIRTTKDKKTGTPRVQSSWAKEFALEVLPPLTPEEIKRLATAQIAAGSVDSNDD